MVKSGGSHRAGEPRQLLVIDSDSVRRGLVACTLDVERFQMSFASSTEVGLDMLREGAPEIVIVGRDSATSDLCQRIRALPAGFACILILMDESYRNEATGAMEIEEAGADAFVPFPIESETFEQRLQDSYQNRLEKEPGRVPRETPYPKHPPAKAKAEQKGKRKPKDTGDAWIEFARRVSAIHEVLDSQDYYKLLEVPSTAPGSDIKEAYYRCAMQYHPDRFARLENEDLKRQIYDVYKRLSEAFKVLINPVTRKYYDKQLTDIQQRITADKRGYRFLNFGRRLQRQTEDLTREAVTREGKRYLHYARLAEAEGRYQSARNYLNQAMVHEPDNDQLRQRLEQVGERIRQESSATPPSGPAI